MNIKKRIVSKINILLLFFIIIVIALESCNSDINKEVTEITFISKEEIMPKDKLKNILKDFFLAESAIQRMQLKGKKTEEYSQTLYDYLFNHYQISEDNIKNSIIYYSSTGEFQAIMESVVVELMELELEIIENKEPN